MTSREELDKQFLAAFQSHKPTIFVELLPPTGVLNQDPACHALWHYAMIVHKRLDDKSGPQYEDDPIDLMNVEQLKQTFMSFALLYKTTPEKMTKFWVNVDMQMRLMNSKLIERKFRFDNNVEIKTQ